ncbi:LuxR C-terminal-related transcriptional regulator [Microbacterium sp. NPDC077663]|uniref:helix-turn-helix transcriptional regulator n=1 Tax=Microbacterium sp. NPDC077663 TaxID=3364189 RepID=UPI0037CC8268
MGGAGHSGDVILERAFGSDRRETAREAIAAALAAGDGRLLLPAIAAEATSLEVFDPNESELVTAIADIETLPASAERSAAVSFVGLWTGTITENGIRTATGATRQLLATAPAVAAALATSAALILLDTARWEAAHEFTNLALAGLNLSAAHPPAPKAPDEDATIAWAWYTLMAVRVLTQWNTHAGHDAYDVVDRALTAMREQNQLRDHHAAALVALGHVQAGRGQFLDAAATLRRAIPLLPAHPASPRIGGQSLLALVLFRSGQWDEARDVVDAVAAAARTTNTLWATDTALALDTLRATADGSPRHLDLIKRTNAIQQLRWTQHIDAILLHAKLLSALQRNDGVTLRTVLHNTADPGYRLLYTPTEWHWWTTVAHHLAPGATTSRRKEPTAVLAGKDEPGKSLSTAWDADLDGDPQGVWDAVSQLLTSLGPHDPVLAAWSTMEAGSLLQRNGDADRASDLLQDAHERFTALGAHAFTRLAPLKAHRGGTYSPLLTPQENRIAALLANGATSTEIATTLHLSRRTVDNHAATILRKLNLTRRRELRP